ncbi:MAG: type II toxin-antitoxin system HicA family toxin [Proteobacteria bacterium]|nr:type II toxin-antitoxin system HicA family toxin [Pseudomonadota bacterium]
MGKWNPCKRKDFIRKLKKIGFNPPESGGGHFYMRYGSYTLTLPGNKEYSVPQIKMLLKEIEVGIKKKLPLDMWDKL